MLADSSVEGDTPASKEEVEGSSPTSKEIDESLSYSNKDKGEMKVENVIPEPSTSQVIENQSGPVSTKDAFFYCSKLHFFLLITAKLMSKVPNAA